MKILFLYLSFVLVLPLHLGAQCVQTEDLKVFLEKCEDGRGEIYLQLLHLEFEQASDSFNVEGNGIDYGNYKYSTTPISLGVYEIDMGHEFTFAGTDLAGGECKVFNWTGPLNCQCSISELVVQPVECLSDSTYSVKTNFDAHGFESFDVVVQDSLVGHYEIHDLPIVLEVKDIDGPEIMEIFAVDRPDCSAAFEIESNPCAECRFGEIITHIVDCTIDSFYVKLNLDHQADGLDSFHILLGGNDYGYFSYDDLPVVVGPLNRHIEIAWHLQVTDQNTECRQSRPLGDILCEAPCHLKELHAELLDCDGAEFKLIIDFWFSSEVSDSFHLGGNGYSYGKYAYKDLPITIEGLTADGELFYEFVATDSEFQDCKTWLEFGKVQCECFKDWPVKAETGECTSDSTYITHFQLTESGTYRLYVNGVLVKTAQAEDGLLIVEDFPASGKLFDYYTLCRGDSCCAEGKIESPVCARRECLITDVSYEILACDSSNYFFVELDFKVPANHSEYFVVQGKEMAWEFSYEDLPVKIGPLKAVDFFSFRLKDAQYLDCYKELTIGRVVCDLQCDLDSAMLSFIECDEEAYWVRLEKVDGTFTNFDVSIGEKYLGYYQRSQLPVDLRIPKNLYGQTFSICVSDNRTCCFNTSIPEPDCDSLDMCSIADLRIDTLECKGDTAWALIDFEFEGHETSFVLAINGTTFFTVDPDQLPIKVGHLQSDKRYVFEVYGESVDCSASLETKLDCPSSTTSVTTRLLVLETSNGSISLRVPDFIDEKTKIGIWNLQGQPIYRRLFSVEGGSVHLKMPATTTGMYVLRLVSREGQIYTQKFIMP